MSDREREFHRFYAELRISDQLKYYKERVKEYRAAHRQIVIVRNWLLLAAAAAAAVGQVAAGTARAGWAVAAAVLAAFAGAITAFESLIGFPQLEKLYADAARNLEEAAVDWEATDPDTDLTAEIERVEAIFRSEIGQWGQLVVKSAAPAQQSAGNQGGAAEAVAGPPDPSGPN